MNANPAPEPSEHEGKRRGRPPGIKARRAFEPSRWWTEGLVSYLTETAPPKRITAAKSYARSGRVVQLNVLPGIIGAKVQGRRRTPYMVRIKFPLPDQSQLQNIRAALAGKAIYRCMLLSGEMPKELGGIFREAGAPLSAEGFTPLRQVCACSEPEETCKHILAVLYAASAVFDRDPFALLKLKGLEKKSLMEFLCAPTNRREAFPSSGDGGEGGGKKRGRRGTPGHSEPEAPPPALDASFYGSPVSGGSSRAGVLPEGNIYPVQIPEFPTWRGETSFADAVAPYYEAVKKIFSGGDGE